MNALVALCHFCELHGPSVLFCTQAFHPDIEELDTTPDDGAASCGTSCAGASGWSFRGKYQRTTSVSSCDGTTSAPATPTGTKTTDFCEACRSAIVSGQRGYVSYDTENGATAGGGPGEAGIGMGGAGGPPSAGVAYVSGHQARHQSVFSMVRQACLRSLSVEVCPGREGPIFFGDDHNGYVFSHTFYIKDSLARGFQRLYSIIVVMMDRIYLLNSWPFLVTYVRKLIDGIQARADTVFTEEKANQPPVSPPQRVGSYSTVTYRQVRGPVKPARSIIELTNDKKLFLKLHQAFTWLLKSGGNRLKEILLEGPPTEDSVVDFEKQELEETDDGFVLVFGQNDTDTDTEMELVEKDSVIREEAEEEVKESQAYDAAVQLFTSLRHLNQVLGYKRFHILAHHVIIGNQIVVRCAHRPLLNSVVDVLKTLIPKGCCKVISWSQDAYIDSWRCNFLGLHPSVTIPEHVELYVLLDITLPERVKGGKGFNGFTFDIRSPLQLPQKAPTILEKMESALCNEKLADSVVNTCLLCVKEEWMNKVKVRFMFTKAGAQPKDEVRGLLPVLGAGMEDMPILQFWMTGLSVQYRKHMLGSAQTR